jgi:hypothetical protein
MGTYGVGPAGLHVKLKRTRELRNSSLRGKADIDTRPVRQHLFKSVRCDCRHDGFSFIVSFIKSV